MKKSWKIGIASLSTLIGVILMIIIGYCAKYYLIDRPKELKQAEKVDTTYIKREMSLADFINMPTTEGNAAQDYIKALKIGSEEREDVKLNRVDGMSFMFDTEAKSLDYILAGAQKTDCDFATMEYQTAEGIINFPTPTAVFLLGDSSGRILKPNFLSAPGFAKALAAKGDQYFVLGEVQKARRIYESILIFGHHLELELHRQTPIQLLVGLTISGIGTERLEKFYSYQGNVEKAAKVKEYEAQTRDMRGKVKAKIRAMGDLLFESHKFETSIRILKEDEDAMFRQIAADYLLYIFVPIRINGQFNNLFYRSRASKALEEAIQNDEDQSVRETARNVLYFVRSKPDWKAAFEVKVSPGIFKKRAEELSKQTSDAEMWIARGLSYYRRGQLNEAIDAYKQAINLQPDYAKAHHELGVVYHAKGMLDDAKNEYELFLKFAPNDVYAFVAHDNLGKVYKSKEMYSEAITEYKKAIALKPEYAPAHANLAEPYYLKGLYDEAIAELKLALYIRGYETPEAAHLLLGGVYADREMYDEAIREFKKAIRLKPRFTEAHLLLADAYGVKGMFNEAIAECQEVLELAPNNAEAHGFLGQCYIQKEMIDEAIAESKKVLELEPDNATAHSFLGLSYLKKGMIDEAIAELKKAVKLARNDDLAYYNLACAYSLKNDETQSIESLKKAINLDRKYIQMAEKDKDFDNIRNSLGFQSATKRKWE